MPTGETRARRVTLLVTAALAISAALAGLSRLSFNLPVGATLSSMHGPLFVLGVFTTLIALERAVALGSRAAYVAPFFGAIAGIGVAVFGRLACSLTIVSAALLVLLNVAIVRRQATTHTWLMLVGSLGLVGTNLAWTLGLGIPEVAQGWLAFFVVTISAERLELARIASPPKYAVRALACLSAVLTVSSLSALLLRDLSLPVFGSALSLIGAWMWRYDLARRTVRTAGLPRYSAFSALLGASWLLVAGGLCLLGFPLGGPRYDAVLHAVFVGYVLSMVFAHAPIIVPTVAGIEVPFHRALYLPLALLHLALLTRLVGDIAGITEWRRFGGLGNALSLALFPLAILWARRALAASRAAPCSLGTATGASNPSSVRANTAHGN
ncbi:MAG TPA: hypothetical protein VGI10_11425 [Polyangiaceae bacterium]|jgi:hypothetical protein